MILLLQKNAPFSRGKTLLLNCVQQSTNESVHRIKLFIPCDDAENDEYGEDGDRNQLALYIHIVKQGVEFFHNLNFCFQKWFRSGFQGAEILSAGHRALVARSTEIKNRAVLFLSPFKH